MALAIALDKRECRGKLEYFQCPNNISEVAENKSTCRELKQKLKVLSDGKTQN